MNGYYSLRVWELRPGCAAADLEELAGLGVLE